MRTIDLTAVLQWDSLQKRAVSALVPTNHQFGAQPVQDMAAWLESYQPQGASADGGTCTAAQLQHLATLGQQAHEFRNKSWLARSSVRSLRAGQWFTLKNSTLDALSDFGHNESDLEFTVHSLGINNLPRELSERTAHSMARAPNFERCATGAANGVRAAGILLMKHSGAHPRTLAKVASRE